VKPTRIALNAVFLSGAIASRSCLAADAAAPPAPAGPGDAGAQLAPVETAKGVFQIGDVRISKAERSITFPAEVNMDKGMLEYLLVHRKGKTHESLLRTSVEPYNLKVAFLLLGFEATDTPLARQGDPATPSGERVRITLSADAGPRKEVIPVEKWLINRFGGVARDVEPLNWVYSGSLVRQDRFMSQETGSIVAIWHDPVAMIDNASPGGHSNAIWFVKEGTAPAVGTPVQVIITPAK
jgi:hypothetical protein